MPGNVVGGGRGVETAIGVEQAVEAPEMRRGIGRRHGAQSLYARLMIPHAFVKFRKRK